ncbi:MAG TPA: hypothetical protein DCF46_01330, partial [Porphyromonadaceae bacterium]|nr:hypothetical protein [Porphyromonadaceae bacterium]
MKGNHPFTLEALLPCEIVSIYSYRKILICKVRKKLLKYRYNLTGIKKQLFLLTGFRASVFAVFWIRQTTL